MAASVAELKIKIAGVLVEFDSHEVASGSS